MRKGFALATVFLATGTLALSACSSDSSTSNSGSTTTGVTPTAEASAPAGPDGLDQTTVQFLDPKGGFYQPTAGPGYFAVSNSILTSTTGDTNNWDIERTLRNTQDGSAYEYRILLDPATLEMVNARASEVPNATQVCIANEDQSNNTCIPLDEDVLALSIKGVPGNYTLYVSQDILPGEQTGTGEETITTQTSNVMEFKFTPPQGALADPPCTLTGGTATRDGDKYTVTVQHEGVCNVGYGYISNIAVMYENEDSKNYSFMSYPLFADNGKEISHTNKETVLEFTSKANEFQSPPEGMVAEFVRVEAFPINEGTAGSLIQVPIADLR